MGAFKALVFMCFIAVASCYMPSKVQDDFAAQESYLAETLLRELEGGIRQGMLDPYMSASDDGSPLVGRSHKDLDALDYELGDDSRNPLARSPSTRDREYLQHSPLWGHQYLSGGAGEGKQRLRPDGAIANQKQVKTDAALPAYCTPPNPCPRGYTAEDGCLEQFENTAAFSRDYQAAQDCMCDQEHMFECPAAPRPSGDDRNDISEADIDRFVNQFQVDNEHKALVAKKFHQKKSYNPYMQGEMLPVAAKKGYNIH